jgi:hypothetical protein
MNKWRLQLLLAIVACALLTVIGAWLALTRDGKDAATLGWLLAVIGAVGLVVNLYLRARTRESRPPR